MLSTGRLTPATIACSQALQGGSTSLWRCVTRGRSCQAFWELRVLVETSRINLVLGEIFYRCKVGALELGALELGAPQVGALELSVLHSGAPELGVPQVGVLELGPGQGGGLELGLLQPGGLELGASQVGALELGAQQEDVLELGPGQGGVLKICVAQIKALGSSFSVCACPPSDDGEDSLDIRLKCCLKSLPAA
jgi:hypothetical protein